jgi:hypothetical protein
MEQFFLSILNYLLDVVASTLFQLFVLLGPLLILAFVMNFVARQSENLSYRLLGTRAYLYGFGWLGTSVHEIGHAIFAIIFGHKITEFKLFTPNAKEGSLGHVNHSYNRGSIYQNIGNFFIGIGPILFGSIILYLITYILFRFNVSNINSAEFTSDSLMNFSTFKVTTINIWNSTITYFDLIFTSTNSSWWKIVVLIYILFSVGSSITLSSADIEGSFSGFIYFIVILLSFNLGTLWIGDFTVNFFSQASNFFSGFYFLIILSMLINIAFIIILLVALAIKISIIQNRYY